MILLLAIIVMLKSEYRTRLSS